MFDADTLLGLGIRSHVISIWPVFVYILIIMPLMLAQRATLSLLITFLFTYYWAFLFYWGDYIAATGSIAPFFLYVVCGLAMLVLSIAASFYDRAFKERGVGSWKRTSWRKAQAD